MHGIKTVHGGGTSPVGLVVRNKDIKNMEDSHFLSFPNEVLMMIFEYLGFRDKMNLRSCCRMLRSMVYVSASISIDSWDKFTHFISYLRISDMNSTSFSLERLVLTSTFTDEIPRIPLSHVPPSLLKRMETFTSFKFTVVLPFRSEATSMFVLGVLPPSLKSLELNVVSPSPSEKYDSSRRTTRMSPELWSSILSFKKLTSLSLNNVGTVSIDLLKIIAKLPLESLSIEDDNRKRSNTPNVLMLEHISGIQTLTSLTIRGYMLKGSMNLITSGTNVLQTLSGLTSLQHLKLLSCTGLHGEEDLAVDLQTFTRND